jgi:translation initiation factor IF-2
MSKVRVYEVAKALNMDQKTLVALFQSMGIGDVRNHMSAVESDVVERVKRHLERQKSPEVVEERIRPTVVKRVARGPKGDVGGVPAPRPSSPGGVPSASPSQTGVRSMGEALRADAPEAPSSSPARRRVPGAPLPPASPAPAPSAPGRAAPPPEPSSRGREVVAESTHASSPLPPAAPAVHRPSHADAAPAPFDGDAAIAPAAAQAEPSRPAAPPVPAAKPSAPRAPGSRARASSKQGAPAAPPEMEMFEPLPSAPAIAEAPRTEILPPPAPPSRPALAPPPAATEPTTIPLAPPTPTIEALVPQHQPAPSPPPAPAVAPRAPAPSPVRPRPAVHERQPVAAQPPTPPPGAPRRPSSPPKTGIEVWQGRAGVPMPAVRTGPPARRQVYDPRVTPAARPGPTYAQGPNRPGQGRPGQGGRPGFRPNQRMQTGPRKPTMVSTQEMASHKKVVKIEEQVTLQQLAGKMSIKATDVLMKLLSMGMSGVHINSTLDADTAKILANEFGWAVEDVAVSEAEALTTAMGAEGETDTELEFRPPIVTVMGHVDHGKTSLLDRIRKASVAEGEAGGITQHVGAYRVETPRGTIAFLDTPGHEAFTEMRARGAKVTDIVILVVAADDGVMPQTREAIAHAQAAKVPIIVAVNKIDKPGADPEKIKRDLASLGLQTEEWGGETLFAHVSAKTGEGIDQLLESVLLQAEVLELKANSKKRASGTVIEALLDRGRGPVARVMVQDGTLRTGDVLLAGGAWGKVRAMTDELGRTVAEAGPSTPVEVLGLNEVPSAGDPVHAVKDARTAEEIAETRQRKASKTLIPQDSRISLDALADRLKEADQLELKLIIKGDVQGSVEAVVHALSKLSAQKVKVTIVHAAVGGITEGDVNLAVASKAVIVGFNVRPAGKAASLAESEGVEIRLYNIIYNAIDDIRAAMEGLLPATKVEKALGKAEVRQVFRIVKIGVVAGCMVLNGLIRRTSEGRLIRDSVVVWTGKLSGLRRFKDDVKEVAEGFECGISLENYQDIKEGDVIESFEIEEIKTKLT